MSHLLAITLSSLSISFLSAIFFRVFQYSFYQLSSFYLATNISSLSNQLSTLIHLIISPLPVKKKPRKVIYIFLSISGDYPISLPSHHSLSDQLHLFILPTTICSSRQPLPLYPANYRSTSADFHFCSSQLSPLRTVYSTYSTISSLASQLLLFLPLNFTSMSSQLSPHLQLSPLCLTKLPFFPADYPANYPVFFP